MASVNRSCQMFLVLTLFVSFVAPLSADDAADFKAGVGMRIITPNPLLPVSGGLGPTQPARGKRGELAVRALVVQRGDVNVGIVQVDALGFPSVLGDRISARVPRIPRKNLLIGSTHTHSAPCCYAFPIGVGKYTGDLGYIEAVCVKAAEALNEALDSLQPAKLKIATGEAKGKIAYNYYAPDLYDRRMSVIQAIKPDGSAIGTLVNYAVHPEVLGPGVGLLSPDLVGPLCDRIEAKAGGMAMFMNGAQGGMITADNRDLNNPADPLRARWNDVRTWEECIRIGELMADEALRIVGPVTVQESPALHCDSLDVKFPVDSPAMMFVIQYSPLKYPVGADNTITSRLNIVNLGSAQILTIPGEALPNIGFYLKRKMRGEHNLLFGLTNDAFGYIMTKVDYNSFPRYDYVSRTSLGEMTGEILIENALALVAKTPEPGKSPAPAASAGAEPKAARVMKIDGKLDDWEGIRSYTDQEGDTHDTDHKLADDKPAPVDHPDADLVEYRVTHDAENLYFFARSRGTIGRTQKAEGDKRAGRFYLAVTIDVDDNDETGYWIHEGGYYPSTRGYDVNAEVEYYDGELNTVCWLNHGALNPAELQKAFLDQSAGQYREGHDGPYPAGFMRVLPGTYKQYTQWVYHDDGQITFVRDKGPVVPGIGKAAISPDGHVMEVAFPYKGFLVNEKKQPIMGLGKKIDISVSLEASGELAPGGDWASDTGAPIQGYVLTP